MFGRIRRSRTVATDWRSIGAPCRDTISMFMKSFKGDI
jgi:hypothetical protein